MYIGKSYVLTKDETIREPIFKLVVFLLVSNTLIEEYLSETPCTVTLYSINTLVRFY